jgi:hypothetical protein
MLSESRSMPGLFLILPFSSSPEDGMVFLPAEACVPKRSAQEENSGAFHISGLAKPDNLAVQTNVRAKCWRTTTASAASGGMPG